jgi:hypothetical protein
MIFMLKFLWFGEVCRNRHRGRKINRFFFGGRLIHRGVNARKAGGIK